ncbi:glycosyltransferase [Patescibacteria group bacterium]
MKSLEVIIPAKNEEKTLPILVKRINKHLTDARINYGIIIAVDKSTDSTLEVAHNLSKNFPVRVLEKKSEPGKGYSLLQASAMSDSEYIAFIDADLQYPPEALPEMFKRITENKVGVVVAHRKTFKSNNLARKLGSRINYFLFGKLLLGLNCDIQSGLKIYRKEVYNHIDKSLVTPWTFDIPLLHSAKELGYSIVNVNIDFEDRSSDVSKVSFVKTAFSIAKCAIKTRIKTSPIYHHENGSITYNKKNYHTHTELPHDKSALSTFSRKQKFAIYTVFGLFVLGIISNFLLTVQIIVAILSFIYFADVLFSLFIITKSLHFPPEITFVEKDINALDEDKLPVYTVLCPLYKEASVIGQFVGNMKSIAWPKNKLEVLLLLEENDQETLEAAEKLDLPEYIRTVVVPHSMPKTKPKACNYGLRVATGEYVVIYDAEDKPDPQQLRKAYLAFKRLPNNVSCVQAKLNYYNHRHNLLTRLFTSEYSLWFDIVLPGLQSINTTIPLGGTSNHFKTDILRKLHGWDPFNVTEDCDLGARLFKEGYKTSIIESTTLEEANSDLKNWVRQRSRWLKGYMQTYFVHMRGARQFFKTHNWHAVIFQLIIGLRIYFILINPILWAMTVAYFAFYNQVGLYIEALYPAPIFYMAGFSFVFGNFMYLYNYMIGCAKKGHWELIKYVYLIPFYWALTSFAAVMAFYQLIFKPHHWEKTHHGLHLAIDRKKTRISFRLPKVYFPAISFPKINVPSVNLPKFDFPYIQFPKVGKNTLKTTRTTQGTINIKTKNFDDFYLNISAKGLINKITTKFRDLLPKQKKSSDSINLLINYERNLKDSPQIKKFVLNQLEKLIDSIGVEKTSGGILIIATGFVSIVNYIYNAFLSRAVSIEEFGLISLASSILFLISVPYGALNNTVAHKAAFLYGKYKITVGNFWTSIRKKAILIGIVILGVWYLAIPSLSNFFNIESTLPLLLLSPIWVLGIASACDYGFLSGNLKFRVLAIMLSMEAVLRLAFAWAFINYGYSQLVYLAIPGSMFLTLLIGWYFAKKLSLTGKKSESKEAKAFPLKFYGSSALIKFSEISYLTADLLLVKHFMNPTQAGAYALIALAGKMIIFIGGMFGQFMIPIISKHIGSGSNSKKAFSKLFFSSTLASTIAYFAIGLFGYYTTPLLFGSKITPIAYLLPLYGLGMLGFSMASTIISYNQVRGKLSFPILSLFITVGQIVLISLFHADLNTVVMVMAITGVAGFNIVAIYHLASEYFEQRARDDSSITESDKTTRILIYNWRDTKHVWAGGAEIYLQELSKRLIGRGYDITLFCGNDKKCSRTDTIDGVKIIRRGGFYTVYIWGFIYYILFLRKKVDLIIDSENGIPFFTPLYANKPIIGLVHHVHQDVFRNSLSKPLAAFAMFLESYLMPLIYRNKKMITVSNSSKMAMEKIGLGKRRKIEIVHPGVELTKFKKSKKSKNPTILYLGRLKPYKSIDTAIKAMAQVLKEYPKAKLKIAGFGESVHQLKEVVRKMKITDQVKFLGRVSEKEKVKLLGESWMLVYPSMMEGWGISAIEANASGTPVIAANVPGLRDSVRNPHTGFLFEYNNHQELAGRINLVISDDVLRKRLEDSSITWSKDFSWEISTENLIKIIERQYEK